MAFKFVLYVIASFLFIAAISYSDSGVSAGIRVSATVEQPLGLSNLSWSELKVAEFENSLSGIEYDREIQLLFRIPQNESAVCIIETVDGEQFYYSVSEDLLPVNSINNESGMTPMISQITVMFSEN
ncbi:MAG: hypothetical protein DRP51_02225 [Candidatus Zixiibacteriota bacterium]|nr:MAG: hypothetical protein DRP51_02225 [candidate division Zixibacteria bacterium]HHI02606.1 hypothetical protein [candidate division Zixibacteria bacterium]